MIPCFKEKCPVPLLSLAPVLPLPLVWSMNLHSLIISIWLQIYFFPLCSTHLVSIRCVSGHVLDTWDLSVNKTGKDSWLH